MASIRHGGRQGKIMNLELELADDDSEEEQKTNRGDSSRVRVEGKKITKVCEKGKSKPKKQPASIALSSTNTSSKRPSKSQTQQNVFDSLFMPTLHPPEPAISLLNPNNERLPEGQPFAVNTSRQPEWGAIELNEPDHVTFHTIPHASQNPNKVSASSMQQEIILNKQTQMASMPVVVGVSKANSTTGTEDKTSALLSEFLEHLANKLSRSRGEKQVRSAALHELSEFVYKCENTEIDAQVITSTKLGPYLQVMYFMILEFNSSDSPEYDILIPRISKLIGKYKRIVSEQVAAGDAVQARLQTHRRLPPAFCPPGRPHLGQELQPRVCLREGRVSSERLCSACQHRERGDRPESHIAHRGIGQRLAPAASGRDGQRRGRLHAGQPEEEGDQEDLPEIERRPAHPRRRSPRPLHEDREVREQNIPFHRICH